MRSNLKTLREARPATVGRASRERWSQDIEAAVQVLWDQALDNQGVHGQVSGIGLAAVGSLGRRDTGPQSELDLVLIHDDGAHPELSGGITCGIRFGMPI